MKLRFFPFLCVPSLLLLSGCAGEGSEDETLTSEDDLSLPAYVHVKSTELGCGDVVRDAFKGSDSAHGYALDAKKGKQYHFEFRAELDGSQNASLAVFDAKTKRRIAVERGGEKLALDFDATTDQSIVVAAYTSRRSADGKYAMKQFCEIAGQNDLASGQTSFLAEETHRNFFRGPMLENARANGVAAPAAAPNGRTGPVEEADVYKIDGTRLFYLNTYRGFLVYDVSNPKAPSALSRLPVHGYPVEMFVQNGVVYALMRDVLELKDTEGALRFEKKRTSQLVAIDVSNPAQPKVLERIDIKGDLREGLTRKVGNSIYVVSEEQGYAWAGSGENNKSRAYVHSFDVSNPKDVKKVQTLKIFEGSTQSVNAQGQSSSRWFEGVTISATSNALMVAENWQTYSSVWGSGYSCGSSQSLQEANVSIIDISNPSGQIRVHTKFKTYGRLGDQFKQSYSVDPVTKKARYFGVFARQEWSSNNCQGSSHIENAVESWDVTNGSAPVRLQKLAFGKPNETVRGTAFDVARGVLYAITAERVDPLYAIGISNPSQMKILSSVDGLSGDMNLFRFIGGKNFLLAIGTDNSNECQGFNSPATGWTSRVQASIIDVQDVSKIRLAQRQCITVNDAQWMGSEVNWNLDQAHKLIGLSEDGLANLVTVPVHYTKKIAGTGGSWDTYKSETAVGILQWDLSKYDATKPPEQQTILENASTVIHPAGEVKRSVVYTQPGTVQRRKLLNLSNTHMSIVDIQNPKAPAQDSVVEIAPYKDRVVAFGNHVVEQIQPYSDYGWMENGTTEFRVKVKGPNVDGAPSIATFTAPSVERAVKFGDDALVLFQRHSFQSGTNWVTELTAQVYDMSNPAAPKKAGSVKLPVDYVSYPRFAAGVSSYFFPYWGDAQDMVESDKGLVFLTSSWTGSAPQRKLVGLNLENLSSPKVTQTNLSNDTDVTMLGLTKDENIVGDATNNVWLSFSKKTGTKDRDGVSFDLVKYSAQRFSWSGNNLAQQGTVNVPGKLAKSFLQGGKRQLLTHDRVFDLQKSNDFAESPRLVLLSLTGNTAKVEDSRALWGMDMRDLVIDDGRVYANLAERSNRFGIMPMFRGPIRYVPPATELRILSSTGDKLSERFAEELGSDGIDLMGVHDRKLFVNLSGDGVLVVDANNVEKPFAREFVRTLGWGWSVEIAGNDALVPAGHYGTYQLGLGGYKRLGQ